MLRFQVSAYGEVKDVNAYKSSGYSDLDDTLVESAKNFIFTPTMFSIVNANEQKRTPDIQLESMHIPHEFFEEHAGEKIKITINVSPGWRLFCFSEH